MEDLHFTNFTVRKTENDTMGLQVLLLHLLMITVFDVSICEYVFYKRYQLSIIRTSFWMETVGNNLAFLLCYLR